MYSVVSGQNFSQLPYSCSSLCLYFIPLYGWIISSCVDALHCEDLSSASGHSGCIHLVPIVNTVYAVSTCVKLDVLFLAFLG